MISFIGHQLYLCSWERTIKGPENRKNFSRDLMPVSWVVTSSRSVAARCYSDLLQPLSDVWKILFRSKIFMYQFAYPFSLFPMNILHSDCQQSQCLEVSNWRYPKHACTVYLELFQEMGSSITSNGYPAFIEMTAAAAGRRNEIRSLIL